MNQKMNVLKALGIICVVMVHAGQDMVNWIPSWRMPMFIFLSGYFFKESSMENIRSYITKKAKGLLVPMFGWHLFYGIIITLLLSFGLVKFGNKLSIKSFFVDSILHGHQYVFSLALWFVVILFFVQCVYIILRKIYKKFFVSEWLLLGVLVVLNILSVALAKEKVQHIHYPNLYLPVIKVMFFMVFFHLGYVYKNIIEKYDEFSWLKLFVPVTINMVLSKVFLVKLGYTPAWMTFPTKYLFMPLVVSVIGIYFWIHVSDLIVKISSEKDVIYRFIKKIGDSTFPIMVHHLFCFWLLTTFFWFLKEQHYFTMAYFDYNKYLTNIWYRLPRYQPVMNYAYITVGVVGSLVIDQFYKYVKGYAKLVLNK